MQPDDVCDEAAAWLCGAPDVCLGMHVLWNLWRFPGVRDTKKEPEDLWTFWASSSHLRVRVYCGIFRRQLDVEWR